MEYRVIRTGSEDELYHYGVKGMKWGHRKARQKAEYGLTKRELKKKIKQAKKTYRRQENPYHTFDGVTGKNWKKVRDANEKEVANDGEINKLKTKRDKAYAAAERAAMASEAAQSTALETVSEVLEAEGDRYASEVNARAKAIGEKYTKRYQDALLKDIGYDDLELGRKMLNDYNIQNRWGKYSG